MKTWRVSGEFFENSGVLGEKNVKKNCRKELDNEIKLRDIETTKEMKKWLTNPLIKEFFALLI